MFNQKNKAECSRRKPYYLSLSTLAFTTIFISSSYAGGGYLDYRNEYLTKQRVSNDRVKMGYFFDSGLDVHLELMWKQKNNDKRGELPANRDSWGHFENNGHGIILNYPLRFEPLKNWTFTPTFSVYSSSYWTTYEPGLEVAYKINADHRIRSRFRVDLDHPSSSNSADKQKTYRTDFWYDWRPKDLPIGITYNFVWYDTENVRWDNKKRDYAQDIKVQYTIENWTPYIAIGDVKGYSKYSDNRQLRLRTGISYSF
ncbi:MULTISPECIES: oligogalacturonate-specific porin KdgM family protein [Providencia]|uniref:oligogalacturonate-specific porin KdgM family protein n=1 Tax=Providencia TaxID=586 RepID=UPI000F76ABBF|nr:oligogalacturonate-specific porin KdgM family protein [Providencia sp. PROV032]MBV2189433.1 oligogalacturonate-specific porin KdgM family protein [Providencia rettgeri]